MTIFGIFWLLIIGYAFINKDLKKMTTVLIFSMIFQCNNVISLETGLSCGPQLITAIAFIVKTFFYSIKKNERKGIDPKAFFILLIYIIFNVFVIKRDSSVFMGVIQIAIYILAFYRLAIVSKYIIDEKYMYKLIKHLTIFILIIGYIQLLMAIFSMPRLVPLKVFIYNETTNRNIYFYNHPNAIRFYATFMEPSYLSCVLIGLLYYFVQLNNKKIMDKIIVILLAIALICTFSTTSYVIAAIIFGNYFMKNMKNKKVFIALTIIILIGIIIGASTNIFNKVLLQKADSKSAYVRDLWNRVAYDKFLQNPIWGNGYKTLRASSIVLDLMGELGIIGLITYLCTLIIFTFNCFSKNVPRIVWNLIISAFLAQLIACPDLDLCSFWLTMYLAAMLSENKKIEGGNYEKNRNINIS